MIIVLFVSLLCVPLNGQADTEYPGGVISEDTTWQGALLVKGSVVVAPQATLRIAPGTVVTFTAGADRQTPYLVVRGRIHAAGTAEQPVLLTADRATQVSNRWGGLVLLQTEKRNQLEQCRIEFAGTGIDARFASVSLKGGALAASRTALLSRDSVVQMSGTSISDAETGLDIHDSEFDGRDIAITSCQRGIVSNRSALVLLSARISNNRVSGIEATASRVKIVGGDISGNPVGARIGGGEGQISRQRFGQNRQTALHLVDSRIRLLDCSFTGNSREALRVEDGLPLILNNSFVSNGINLYNAGSDAVSAQLNWWGSIDPPVIRQGIHDSLRDRNLGDVTIAPWLTGPPLPAPH